MYDYVHYAENVPLPAVLFHMCTWVEWLSHARIDNIHHHLDVFFNAINSKRFNGFGYQVMDVGCPLFIIDLYHSRAIVVTTLQQLQHTLGGGECVVTISSNLCIASCFHIISDSCLMLLIQALPR